MQRLLQGLAPVVTDTYLEPPDKSMFSVVMPEGGVNLCTTPVGYEIRNGVTAVSGASLSKASFGKWAPDCVKVTPSSTVGSGLYYKYLYTLAGWNTFSFYFYGTVGVAYKACWNSLTTPAGSVANFVGKGYWERYSVTFYETVPLSNPNVYIVTNASSTTPFYIDGLQHENSQYPTTFLTGAMEGFIPGVKDYWFDVENVNSYDAVSISRRSSYTSSGGKEIPFISFGARLISTNGLDTNDRINQEATYASSDYGYLQGIKKSERSFTIDLELSGDTREQLDRNKTMLLSAFNADRVAPRQQILLKYRYVNDCGDTPYEHVIYIKCVYVSGLFGARTNENKQRVSIGFKIIDNGIWLEGRDGVSGFDAATFASLGTINYALRYNTRTHLFESWLPGTGFNDAVLSLASIPRAAISYVEDQFVYIGGKMTTLNGSNFRHIGYYHYQETTATGTFTEFSTGVNGDVYVIKVNPYNNKIYMGGAFTQSTSGTTLNGVCELSGGTTFVAMTTGVTGGSVYDFAFDKSGNVLVVGSFTQAGGVASTAYAAWWDGTAWHQLPGWAVAAINGTVHAAIAVPQPDNSITFYMAGSFTAPYNLVMYYNSSLSPVTGQVGTNTIYAGGGAMSLEYTDTLYMEGAVFTDAGMTTGVVLALVNNVWTPLGNLDVSLCPSVFGKIKNTSIGLLTSLLGSYLYPEGLGVNLGPALARWTGSGWSVMNFLESGSTSQTIEAIDESIALGYIYIGGMFHGGTGITSAAQTITNRGSAETYPVFYLTANTNACNLLEIANLTTNKTVKFNFGMFPDEQVVVNFDPINVGVYSSIRGRLGYALMPGSSMDGFKLIPGNNVVSIMTSDYSSAADCIELHKVCLEGINYGERLTA